MASTTTSISMDGTTTTTTSVTNPPMMNAIGTNSDTTGSTNPSTGSHVESSPSNHTIILEGDTISSLEGGETERQQQHNEDNKKNILTFGSCNDPYQYNALWSHIEKRQPTAFIWCGDAIYADKPQQQPPPPTSLSSHSNNTSNRSSSLSSYSYYWNIIRQYLLPSDRVIAKTTMKHQCATPDVFDIYYQQQLNVPEYQSLLTSSSSSSNYTAPHIYGTLDDHDYGCNNADRTYPYKYDSGRAFLKFMNISTNSMMYQRGLRGEGIYGVQLYDFTLPRSQQVISDIDANIDADITRFVSSHQTTSSSNSRRQSMYTYSNQTVAVFVLDVRTHKTPWKQHWYERLFYKDETGDFLGTQQLEWLQSSIQQSNATIHIFISGIQFHPYRYPDGNIAESWSQYPYAQQTLYNIILSSSKPSILISGDVHMTQFLQKDCIPYTSIIEAEKDSSKIQSSRALPRTTRRLFEMTTSGMTHSWGTLAIPLFSSSLSSSNTNTIHNTGHQQSPLLPSSPPPYHQHSYFDLYISYISKLMIHLLHYTCPWTDIISIPTTSFDNNNKTDTSTCTVKTGLQYSLEQNFGEIEFDFQQQNIHLRTIGTNGQPLLQIQYTFDELSSGPAKTDPYSSTKRRSQQQQRHYLSMKDYQDEIRNNPKLYSHYNISINNSKNDNPNSQWVCINHRGRDTALQLVTGYVTSIAILTVLVPLPILIPPSVCVVLVLFVLRQFRRRRQRRSKTTDIAAIPTNLTMQKQQQQHYPSRMVYPPILTTANTATKRHTISALLRFTWVTHPVPESTNGQNAFFPSGTEHHHNYKKY